MRKDQVSLTRPGATRWLPSRGARWPCAEFSSAKCSMTFLCNNHSQEQLSSGWEPLTIVYRSSEEAELLVMGPERTLPGRVRNGGWRRAPGERQGSAGRAGTRGAHEALNVASELRGPRSRSTPSLEKSEGLATLAGFPGDGWWRGRGGVLTAAGAAPAGPRQAGALARGNGADAPDFATHSALSIPQGHFKVNK